jgi:hypothetical protein
VLAIVFGRGGRSQTRFLSNVPNLADYAKAEVARLVRALESGTFEWVSPSTTATWI